MAGEPTQKTAASKEETEKNLLSLGNLEEDDEFEEFPVEDWTRQEQEGAAQQHLWEDNWDDDDVSDDFSKQLRAELEKQAQSQKMQH